MPETPDLDPAAPDERTPYTPSPEIDPAATPLEAPQTTPYPGDGGAGRPLDMMRPSALELPVSR